MFDTWETDSTDLFIILLLLAVPLVAGIAVGVHTEKNIMQKEATAAGVAYWTTDKDGSAQFKYITQ